MSNVVAAGNPCKVICTIDEHYDKQSVINKDFIRVNS